MKAGTSEPFHLQGYDIYSSTPGNDGACPGEEGRGEDKAGCGSEVTLESAVQVASQDRVLMATISCPLACVAHITMG